MLSLLKISWLIPVIPFLASVLVVTLLILFNRTINRLTKPISLFLIVCVGFSTILSILLLLNNVTGDVFDGELILSSFNINLSVYLNNFIEKILSAVGFVFIIVMILSYYYLDRKTGYVRYLSFVTAFSAIIFFLVLNNLTANPFI